MKKGLSLEQKIHEYCYHNFSHNYLILFVISGATMKPISHQVKVQNRSYLMKKYIYVYAYVFSGYSNTSRLFKKYSMKIQIYQTKTCITQWMQS